MIVVLFFCGVQSVSRTAREEQLRSAQQAVRRAAVQCYAIEGRYPSSVAYLKENYGLVVDEEKYVIHYQNMGDNLLPEIAVFLIEDGFDGQQ